MADEKKKMAGEMLEDQVAKTSDALSQTKKDAEKLATDSKDEVCRFCFIQNLNFVDSQNYLKCKINQAYLILIAWETKISIKFISPCSN